MLFPVKLQNELSVYIFFICKLEKKAKWSVLMSMGRYRKKHANLGNGGECHMISLMTFLGLDVLTFMKEISILAS